MRSLRAFAVACVLTLAFPVAGAAWNLAGAIEPDTPEDRADPTMPQLPDQDPDPAVRRVYFSVVAQEDMPGPGGARYNTNVLPGARMLPLASFSASAYLGVWKDCNRDGYVGSADGALWQYHTTLLPDTTLCPPGTSHHNDSWVVEFVWISPIVYLPGWPALQPPHVIVDPEAVVWGDLGRPGDSRAAPCDVARIPAGTTSRTAGLVALADCALQRRGASALETLDETAGTELAFDDPDDPQGDCGHPLNQPVGLLHDRRPCPGETPGKLAASDEPLVTTFDCRRSPSTNVNDPTGLDQVPNRADGSIFTIPTFNPGVSDDPMRASLYEPVNATAGVVIRCPYYPFPLYLLFLLAGPGVIPYGASSLEAPDASEVQPAKRTADFLTEFADGSLRRGGSIPQPVLGRYPYNAGVTVLEETYGVGYTTRGDGKRAPEYSGLVRSDYTPAGATHLTFYARVGRGTVEAVALPPTRTYGSEACADGLSGIVAGWDCDATHWWSPAYGATAAPSGVVPPRPGWSYHYRDVDCYDGSVGGGIPLRASLADVSQAGACAP